MCAQSLSTLHADCRLMLMCLYWCSKRSSLTWQLTWWVLTSFERVSFHVLLVYTPPQDELGVHPLVYVTPWFMCLFTSLPCWDTVLAIADLFFLEGVCVSVHVHALCDVCSYMYSSTIIQPPPGCNTIFRVALAIMEASARELPFTESLSTSPFTCVWFARPAELVAMSRVDQALPFLQHLPSRLWVHTTTSNQLTC